MRVFLFTCLTGLILAATGSEAHAQRFMYRNTVVAPTPFPGNFRNTVVYTAPYNQSTITTGVYPTPFGYTSYYTTTNTIQPLYSGPFHSIIWDPTTLQYRYVTGTANTPSYNYNFVNPYYPY